MEFPAVFIHVLPWHSNYDWFTVTGMSGNATTYAWQEAADDLSCAEAAALLGVPPAALERWAQRLAFPHAVGGASTRFRRAEIEALRDALVRSHSVEGAVRAAREHVGE
jgi:helix-turn-helix protein